jgi:hypothetical protein
MNPESCTLYENCECPLCPLEADSNQVWYSEDEICKNPDFHIVGNSMKKLKKKGTPGYFTLQILDRDFVVRKGIEGIDADLVDSVKDPWKEYQEREDVAEKHPEISKARSDNLKLRGKSLADSRKLIQKVLSDNSFSEIVNPKGIILVLTLNLLRNQ